jgi:uncharacterized protein YjiS (DUF1127 family)
MTTFDADTLRQFDRAARLVDGLHARLQAARARREAESELAAMSNIELADMSINRSDVTRVFDREFLHDYAPRGAARSKP